MGKWLITGELRKADDSPLAGVKVSFQLSPGNYDAQVIRPEGVVIATTDTTGILQIYLCTGSYLCLLPDNSIFRFSLPEGTGSASLAYLRGLADNPNPSMGLSFSANIGIPVLNASAGIGASLSIAQNIPDLQTAALVDTGAGLLITIAQSLPAPQMAAASQGASGVDIAQSLSSLMFSASSSASATATISQSLSALTFSAASSVLSTAAISQSLSSPTMTASAGNTGGSTPSANFSIASNSQYLPLLVY